MALTKAKVEAIWLKKLLFELGFLQNNPTIMYFDSQSAISLSKNPRYYSKSKQVNTKYHFTRKTSTFLRNSAQTCSNSKDDN